MVGSRRGGKKKRTIRLFDRSVSKKAGLPPGSVVPIGAPRDFSPWVDLIQYGPDDFHELFQIDPDRLVTKLRPDLVNWVNVEGVHEAKIVQNISGIFDLHVLTQEDIVNTQQRPHFDAFRDYYFFAIKMLLVNTEGQISMEHVSLVLKGPTVITFQEVPGDVFGRIRERIRLETGKVRNKGSDYLIYMLIDSVVDGYYQVVDHLAGKIDHIEEELRGGPRDAHLAKLFDIRRESLFLRKNIMPVRDLLNKVNVEGKVFQENTKIYLRDLSDHIQQVTDALNLAMEMTTVLIETYHSMQNQKLNAVMKTLTIISTIFLPLNFIAGVYGMNFKYMPELEFRYGYLMALGIMLGVAIFMIGFFIRKGWLLENIRRNDFLPWGEEGEEKA